MENKKTITIIIAIITALLALVAVYTGLKLWQLSRKPAEEIKKEKPAIMEVIPVPCEENSACQISFTLKPRTSGTPSPTPTEGPSPTPTTTGTPGPSETPTPGPSATPTPGPGPTNTPVPGATNTPFPGATETPGPGPTNTPPPDCFDSCTTTDECSSSLTCIDNRCVNAECPDQTDCVCPAPEIPVVGISSPTLILGIGGLLLLMIGLLL